MNTSMFVFASDLHDEGYSTVLDNIARRGKLGGVTLACSYHHSRDLFPHNPMRKIAFLRGEVFFQPTEERYSETQIRPIPSPLVAKRDPLQTLCDEAGERGLAVRAWTNNMHNTDLGERYPDCTVQNVFGDAIITCLCPANPDVRAYVAAMSTDIARYPIHSLLLESLGYMPYDHGYHHERTLLPLSGAQRLLMSLCFCPHCRAAGVAAGADMARIQRFVRTELEHVLAGEPSATDGLPLEQAAVGALADGELALFLQARIAVVSSLAQSVVAAVQQVRPIPVVFMELSGGLRGVGSGMTVAGGPTAAPERAWQDGVDVRAVAQACAGLAVLGYTSDAERLGADLAAYRELLPPDRALAVALRPMLPDCQSAADVARLLGIARGFAPDWIDFYHYGLMRLSNLDWVGQALGDINV